MGILITKLWGQLFGDVEHKLVIVGLNNSGKTTILYKLLLDEVVATSPTVGSNVEEVVYKNIRFLMWDIGGQETCRSTWSSYFTNAEAVILVIDSTERGMLPTVGVELGKMLQHEYLSKAIFLVYANKQDLRGAMTASEISDSLLLHTIKTHEWHIQPCCALTGEGLHQGLDWIVQRIRTR
eukprot:TRINITY_DN5961_c0_g1_i1.p1 TRINITY_DN5961_c0_g1~~TRINITY_DN5961_c0_g1_i1.p1  ORF type:complete len:181 (+),score=21.38 TRINITY_DN5961_c0_g1_i1:217-759(+)